MPRSGRNRRKDSEMSVDIGKAAQDQMRKEKELERKSAERDRIQRGESLDEAQRKHDEGMRNNPDQAKALEATDNAAAAFASQVDHDIAQKEQELAALRQQKANAEASREPKIDPNVDREGIVDTENQADGDPLVQGKEPRSVLSDQSDEANKSDPIGNTSFAHAGGGQSPGAIDHTKEAKTETDHPSAEEDKTDGPTISASAKKSEDIAQSTSPTKADTNQSKFSRSHRK